MVSDSRVKLDLLSEKYGFLPVLEKLRNIREDRCPLFTTIEEAIVILFDFEIEQEEKHG